MTNQPADASFGRDRATDRPHEGRLVEGSRVQPDRCLGATASGAGTARSHFPGPINKEMCYYEYRQLEAISPSCHHIFKP